MKDLFEIITEAKTTPIVNKIKKAFADNWGDNVQLVSCKHKLYMCYYVYIYDIANLKELRKVDDVLKDNIEIYQGMPDDKLQKKFDEITELVRKHTNEEGITKYLYDIPCIFIGFTSQDLK